MHCWKRRWQDWRRPGWREDGASSSGLEPIKLETCRWYSVGITLFESASEDDCGDEKSCAWCRLRNAFWEDEHFGKSAKQEEIPCRKYWYWRSYCWYLKPGECTKYLDRELGFALSCPGYQASYSMWVGQVYNLQDGAYRSNDSRTQTVEII